MSGGCGHCHTCHVQLEDRISILGDWCAKCRRFRRYKSHGVIHGEGSAYCDPAMNSDRDLKMEQRLRDKDRAGIL